MNAGGAILSQGETRRASAAIGDKCRALMGVAGLITQVDFSVDLGEPTGGQLAGLAGGRSPAQIFREERGRAKE